MTVSENEEAIYKQLNKNRLKLYATLSKKINVDTDDYFYKNDGVSIYYPDLENLNEFTFWNPNPGNPCKCPQFTNEGNGVISFLGAVFKTGWENTEQWEMVADIKFGKLWKTGLILLTDADNPFPRNGYQSEAQGRWGISAWERFIGTPYTLDGDPHYEITYEGNSEKFTSYSSSWADNVWHSLHMKKVSSTRLIVWLDDNEDDRIIYDWEELSDVERVTFGATMNHNTSDYGNCPNTLYNNMQNIRLYVRDLYVFYPALPTNRLTPLCEDTKKIKCSTNNVTTLPPQPTIVSGNTLAINEFNIHNKVQYCNNVLRYTLRKRGIDFTDEETNELSNEMHELIKFIDEILTTPTIDIDNIYSAYVNPVQLTSNKSTVQTGDSYNLTTEVVDGGAGIEVGFFRRDLETNTDEQLYLEGEILFEDEGVTDNKNTNWFSSNYNNSGTIITDENGTAISSDDYITYYARKNLSSSEFGYDIPFIIEFDVLEYTGSIIFGLTVGMASNSLGLSDVLDDTDGKHIKISLGYNYMIKIFVDDIKYYEYQPVEFGLYVNIGFSINNGSIKYKNFKVYRAIETISTNANGIATFPLIADGSGEEHYIAKVQDLESNDYDVIDGIFYDTGLTGTGHYYNPNSVSNVASLDGRTFTNSDSSARYIQVVPSTEALANKLFYTPPFVVELDLISHSGTSYVAIGDGSNNHYWNFTNISNTEHHLKYVITSTSQNLYLDNSDTPSRTTNHNLGNCRIQLVLGSGGSMKFKNFVVYPI